MIFCYDLHYQNGYELRRKTLVKLRILDDFVEIRVRPKSLDVRKNSAIMDRDQ